MIAELGAVEGAMDGAVDGGVVIGTGVCVEEGTGLLAQPTVSASPEMIGLTFFRPEAAL